MGKARQIEIGREYGKVLVMGVAEDHPGTTRYYKCRCKVCGREFEAHARSILDTYEKQDGGCGACLKKAKIEKSHKRVMDKYVGARYGNATVKSIYYTDAEPPVCMARCVCDCGNEFETTTSFLTSGIKTSCKKPGCHLKILGRKTSKSNTSGTPGVYYVKTQNRWVARIKIARKEHYLGTFETYEEARSARLAAEKELPLVDVKEEAPAIKTIGVRLSEEEYDALKKLAAQSGVSLNRFCSDALRNTIKKKP